MNERILKLSIAAKKYAETKPDIYQVAYDKKFAELIVRECVQVVNAADDSCEDYYGPIIKDHFGIE